MNQPVVEQRDLALREQPLTVDLDEFAFVVPEPIKDTAAVGIVVGVMNQ